MMRHPRQSPDDGATAIELRRSSILEVEDDRSVGKRYGTMRMHLPFSLRPQQRVDVIPIREDREQSDGPAIHDRAIRADQSQLVLAIIGKEGGNERQARLSSRLADSH